MTDCRQLLADYAQTRSEPAFREIVTRYLNLVYSSALRLVDGDEQRAKDIAQLVFADLARKAGELSPEIMLGGWLHRHTCFVAANTMRGERRRLAREREAVEMNSLHDDAGVDFARLAPLLDETINQLDETDRAAILLRFFEQKDFRSVGQVLDSSEDAARMRVNRALDKLRELLAQRGIRTTAAALSVAIAANTVQAAPAGLAVAISTAAFAGTAATTSTFIAATTKTIAMTTLQKTLVTATVAVLAGAVVYEARHAAQLHNQVQALQQQQAPLAEQIRQLQNALDAVSNRNAALQAEDARWKSAQSLAELLKLRGQVGVLRQQLASASKSNLPANAIANLVNDPAQKELARIQIQKALQSRYAPLVKALNLPSETVDKLYSLITENELNKKDRLAALLRGDTDVASALQERDKDKSEMEQQIRNLLGNDGYSQFDGFNTDTDVAATVKSINDRMGINPLNDEQLKQLETLIRAEPPATLDDVDLFRSQESLEAEYQALFNRAQNVRRQFDVFLSPDQSAAFETLFTKYWNELRTKMTLGQQLINTTLKQNN